MLFVKRVGLDLAGEETDPLRRTLLGQHELAAHALRCLQ